MFKTQIGTLYFLWEGGPRFNNNFQKRYQLQWFSGKLGAKKNLGKIPHFRLYLTLKILQLSYFHVITTK